MVSILVPSRQTEELFEVPLHGRKKERKKERMSELVFFAPSCLDRAAPPHPVSGFCRICSCSECACVNESESMQPHLKRYLAAGGA